MKTLSLKMPVNIPVKKMEPYLIAWMLVMVWFTAQKLMVLGDSTSGQIDQSIWLLVLLAIISFLLILGLCWWLLRRFWINTGLPDLGEMVLQFKELMLWEQLKFVLCLFALLLLGAVGALIAIL